MEVSRTRREFLRSAGALAAASIGGSSFSVRSDESVLPTRPRSLVNYQERLSKAPKLFCTAYITPDAPGQGGQEALVAKYPLALVPQDTRFAFVKWRNRIRTLNPNIVFLGYLLVIEVTTVPGPGHDELRKLNEGYCEYPGGFVPTVNQGTEKKFRIFDPRNGEWQRRFLEACRITLASYPYDGLFLDDCTVFERAHPLPNVKREMREALQSTLLRVRAQHPDALLIGNSAFNWIGLNGELVEDRSKDIATQLAPFAGHTNPQISLVQSLMGEMDPDKIKPLMQLAHAHGAYYGVAKDYQHIVWPSVFDEL